jgi:manganese peroxidase
LQSYKPPGALGSYACSSDTCCVWDYLAKDLVQLFTACDGTCNSIARSAIRFAFHDAAAWDLTAGFGGADGSLFLSADEITRSENNGLQSWRQKGLELLQEYGSFGIGAADLAQFAHNVAVVVCPLGPRTLTYVGRESSRTANLPNLLPNVNSSATTLIDLFSQKSISYVDLVALIGAHSAAQQFTVDPSKAGEPLDSTPGIWDVKFYQELLAGTPPP